MTEFKHGVDRNADPKVQLLRRSKSFSTGKYGSGGREKAKHKPKAVTLPSLETLRQLKRTSNDD